MATPIRMPQPGQMTEECTILQWFKQEGDSVAKGDPLFEIETDKSDMDIEAFDTGTLLRIVAAVGVTVPVDSVVAWIGEPGEEIPETGSVVEPSAVVAGASEAAAPAAAPGGAGLAEAPGGAGPGTPRIRVGEYPGADGAAERTTVVAADDHSPGGMPGVGQLEAFAAPRRRLAISPRARRLAAEHAIDPSTLVGTGPGGRIVARDVRAAAAGTAAAGTEAAEAATTETAAAATAATPGGAPARDEAAIASSSAGATQPDEGEPLSRLRQIIARRLTESVTTIPHFTVTVSVDMTDLVALRAELREASSPVSITDFIHSATIGSLVEFPLVNSLTDGKTLWRRERVHLGIAVSIPGGLLVPVVRDAHELSLPTLAERTRKMVAVAREGKLGPDDLSGSTFTVSNMGMFGVDEFSAIINPGESGILAVSSIKPTPTVAGDGIAIRQMMSLTLSADHRLVDGELGARFLDALRHRLQDARSIRAQVPLKGRESG